MIPSNLSYDDPIPFECEKDPNVNISLTLYSIQAFYLLFGSALNILIIRVIITSRKSIYIKNHFYVLYAVDALEAVIRNIIEIFISRVFTFVTPLCSIISPYFFTPSLSTKIYYTFIHYATTFRIISQILMSFNRMTCVILPMKHERIWKTVFYPVIIMLFLVPFDTSWIILMARVYVNPNAYGFSVNYIETNGLPKLSLIHLIESTVGFVVVITCFIATLIGLTTLENRLKTAERSLTFVTVIMAIPTLLFTFIQIYFAFLVPMFPAFVKFFFQIVPYLFDFISVFSPLALILTNRDMKSDIFKRKYSLQNGLSRSVSMTQQQIFFRTNTRNNIII